MKRVRVEFRLTMPGRNTWNGKWSGDERNHTLIRELDIDVAAKLNSRSWSYSWRDGWCASVAARIVPPRSKLAKSDGFIGYDWMVDSIIRDDKIYADHERPGVAS